MAHKPVQLVPGGGLQPFRLGQSLPEVLTLVRAHRNSFRLVEVKFANPKQVQASSQQPPVIAICFPEHGFHLVFDGHEQRLRLVEVHDPTRLQLCFGGHVFGGAAQPPTFGRICEAFGPTYPGEPRDGHYPLQYPGIIFLFPMAEGSHAQPQQQQQQQQHGPALAGSVHLPVALTTPAARIVVHSGSAATLAAAQAAPPPPLPRGSLQFEPVEAAPGQGLLFAHGGQLLRFGDSPQDVVSELGEPSSTHSKPARPASPAHLGAPALVQGVCPDYYYSYAARGLDVLFCGTAHRLKKLVLHANAPAHPDFGLYSRCNFRVHAPGTWSLPGAGCGDEGGGSPLGTSNGSEGGASMKTAASDTSLAATEAQAGHGGGEVLPPAAELPTPPVSTDPQAVPAQQNAPASGLTAAYHMLVGFMDDVIHIDGDRADSRSADQRAAGSVQQNEASSPAHVGSPSTLAAPTGRPPRPPLSHPIADVPVRSSKSSKKKKKRDRQRAAAVAKHAAPPGGGEAVEIDTDTDASFADSAPSSLASSPGMTSFLSHIAVTGGAPTHPAAIAGAAGPGGHSDGSDGSTADWAGKERRLENGSAFDGWSEADDLALLVGEEAPPPAGHAAQHVAGTARDSAQALPAGQQGRLRVSTAVQTAPGADGIEQDCGAELTLGLACSPTSPDSFVLADSPELFNEATAAAEYESVPRQRSSGTQTHPRLLAGPPLHGGSSGAAPGVRRRRHMHSACAAVGVDSSLADIQAAFGWTAKPALHTRLGGRHPFGPTHLFAYRGVVFEVLRSGSIATVTLFEP